MARVPRKHRHVEHLNHEAWAIPYGDLITLLLAFFVVMYSISSVNQGKYRTVSEALSTALRGGATDARIELGNAPPIGSESELDLSLLEKDKPETPLKPKEIDPVKATGSTGEIRALANKLEETMDDLIADDIVVVRGNPLWLEVELQTDVLFASGQAQLSDAALSIMQRLADDLKHLPNLIRVEGHTDDVPISTAAYPSNWELSAARAASVVSLLMQQGVEPTRLSVIGLGQYHPVVSNATAEGRNRNRRVLLVIPSVEHSRKAMNQRRTMGKSEAGDAMSANSASVDHQTERLSP